MPRSYCHLMYHIVFSTKQREPWLRNEIRTRMHEYLGGIIRKHGGTALIVNGTLDHVHLLANLRQDKSVSDVVCSTKSNSSGWVHRTFPELAEFGWQAGYGAFTVSPSQLERTRKYITRQAEHHKKLSFKEEFVALLKAHKIEYDERYLWD